MRIRRMRLVLPAGSGPAAAVAQARAFAREAAHSLHGSPAPPHLQVRLTGSAATHPPALQAREVGRRLASQAREG